MFFYITGYHDCVNSDYICVFTNIQTNGLLHLTFFHLPTSLELPWMCGRMHFRF